jgi:mycofactocin precursor
MTDPQDHTEPAEATQAADLAENALVEEVSIDGMCGVY